MARAVSVSIINQFKLHDSFRLCLASVHLPYPFHLVSAFSFSVTPFRFASSGTISSMRFRAASSILAQYCLTYTQLSGTFLFGAEKGIRPAALGQCRRQPGELKKRPPDAFLPRCAPPFPSNPFLFHCINKKHPYWVLFCLAQRKGFEPLLRFPVNTISSRARYDHFDTAPRSVRTSLRRRT